MAPNRFVDSLSQADLQPLFEAIRSSLKQYFSSHKLTYGLMGSQKLSKSCGVFITYRDNRGNLRGSMGLLDTDRPLNLAAIDCAVSAAKDDPRYEKLMIGDVDAVSIELTLIRDVEEITNNLSAAKKRFENSVNGIYAEGELRAGILLPREIFDLGLDFDSAVERLKMKSGMGRNASKLRYFMFSARTFLQEAARANAIELGK